MYKRNLKDYFTSRYSKFNSYYLHYMHMSISKKSVKEKNSYSIHYALWNFNALNTLPIFTSVLTFDEKYQYHFQVISGQIYNVPFLQNYNKFLHMLKTRIQIN